MLEGKPWFLRRRTLLKAADQESGAAQESIAPRRARIDIAGLTMARGLQV
jgi:hypothetical protein